MMRVLLASVVVSVGVANFASAPTFDVPRVDFRALAALDNSEATLLLHSLTSLGLVAVTDIPGFSEARKSALATVGESCLVPGGAATQSRTLLVDGSVRRTAATSTAPGGHAERFASARREDLPSPPNELFSPSSTTPTCDVATATLRALVDLGAKTVFRGLDHALRDLFGGQQGAPLMKRAPHAAAAAAAAASVNGAGLGGSSGYESFVDLMSSGEQLEHFHVYSPPPPPSLSPINPPSAPSLSSSSTGSPAWKAALELHTDSGLLIAMTTGFEGGESNTGLGSGGENNQGLFVSLPHGSVARASVPDGALLFMVGESGEAWINLLKKGDIGSPLRNGSSSSSSSGGGLKLRAVPHALVLPWQQEQQRLQDQERSGESFARLPLQWWRSWHGRMFLPPSDALVPLHHPPAPSSSSSSSSTPSPSLVPFSDFRAAQIRLVTTGAADERPTLGCGLSGTSSKSTASATATTASTGGTAPPSFLRTLMGDDGMAPMDDDGGCGSGEVLCWMQCMPTSALSCGPGTQPECVDTTTDSVVSGGITCPSGAANCAAMCAAAPSPSPPSYNESSPSSSGFCLGSGTDMYMDGFQTWLFSGSGGDGEDSANGGKLLCLNLLFSSWTLDSKAKVAFACLGTLALAIFSEFMGKARREASRLRMARLAKNRQKSVLNSHLGRSRNGDKYTSMDVSGGGGGHEGKAGGASVFVWASSLCMSLDDLGMAFLFGVQVSLGYFLMLIAMTYQAELFACVVLGLAVGHALFNLQEPPSTNTDPCCAEPHFEDDAETKDERGGDSDTAGGVEGGIEGGRKSMTISDGSGAEKGGGSCYRATVVLEVGGMTCGSCVSTVKRALERHAHVKSARVSLPSDNDLREGLFGSAVVECEGHGNAVPGALIPALVAAVEATGFEAVPGH